MISSSLKKIRGVPVVVVGDVVVDRYSYGTVSRMSREAPVPIVDEERVELRPGGAANAAVNVAALLGRATLLGVIGSDRTAEAFQISMRGRGVNLDLTVEAGRETAQKVRIMAASQGTRHQQVLRMDRSPSRPPSQSSLAALQKSLRRHVKEGCRSILVSDYGQGMISPDLVNLLQSLAESGCHVVFDSRYSLSVAQGPVVLKPNAAELSQLVGHRVDSVDETIDACRVILQRSDARAVVATRGREGMVVVERVGAVAILPMHGTAEVTDVTGAGDTVAAVLATALGAGIALSSAAQLATVAASVVVGKIGSAVATPVEIRAAGRPTGRIKRRL